MKKSVLLGASAGVAAVTAAAVCWGINQLNAGNQPVAPQVVVYEKKSGDCKPQAPVQAKKSATVKIVRGTGYVRGSSTRSLKNK
ncbi:MAG: hypothetical protein J6Q81_08935, partial [Lentisphaeria bacterium]|nr:hypothetical protein [Lentisphaeria bacterium]